MGDKRILVACSDLDYLLIDKILRNGFFLDRAGGVEEILEKDQEKEYHLLLVDISLLKSDLEFRRKLRERGRNIVALSSEPGDARERRIREFGCKACYVKPFQLETFSLFVKYWCR